MQLQKTRGIVLKMMPYNDKNKIVKIYTEHFGLRTFMVGAGASKQNRQKISILQSLQPIWLETSFTETGKLSRLGEISTAVSIIKAMQHPTKRSILLFLNEALYKCLREEQADEPLFEFIIESIIYLNNTDQNCNNFHLVFLVDMCRYLGFSPTNNYSSVNKYFCFKDGIFDNFNSENLMMDIEQSALFAELINLDFRQMEKLPLNSQTRNKLLCNILLYYSMHLSAFTDIKSLEVLAEIHAV